MFCSVDAHGRRPSHRAIAQSLGVTVSSVEYWKRTDQWIKRNEERLDAVTRMVTDQSQNLKALLRAGAMEAVTQLRNTITDGKSSGDDRLKASIALFKLAKDSNAIDLDLVPDAPSGRQSELTTFNDELPVPESGTEGEPEPWESSPSLSSSPISSDSGEPLETLPETSPQP